VAATLALGLEVSGLANTTTQDPVIPSTRDSSYSDGNTSGLGSGRGNEYSNENTRTGVTGDENLTGGRAAGTDGLPSSNYDRSGASRYEQGKERLATTSSDGYGGETMAKKPSLMDRINPMKDSNGDGQKGFMK